MKVSCSKIKTHTFRIHVRPPKSINAVAFLYCILASVVVLMNNRIVIRSILERKTLDSIPIGRSIERRFAYGAPLLRTYLIKKLKRNERFKR